MGAWPPGSPQPTHRATSRAPAARACSPTSAGGCGASPTTSALILPFEEVMDALGRRRPRGPRAADRPARRDRRHRGPRRRLRPRLPAHVAAAAQPLGADRRRAAARGVAAAELALPRRRPLLRPRRAPPGVGREVARPRGHRRLRRRDPDARAARARPARRRPAAQGPRAAVPRARAARPGGARADLGQRPWDFGRLAEAVEAWGFRAMQDRGSYMDRREVAHVWF